MSAIDQLKDNNVVIDTTGSDTPVETAADSLVIGNGVPEYAQKTSPKKVVLGTNNKHKVILPKSSERKTANINDIATVKEDPYKDDKVSIDNELLNLDDPNSLMSKYLAEKTEEMNEYMQEKEEEREVDALDDDDDDSTGTDSIVIDTTDEVDDSPLETEEDSLDLSDFIEDDEDDEMKEIEENEKIEEEISEVVDAVAEDREEVEEETETVEEVTEEKAEEVEEDNEPLDLDIEEEETNFVKEAEDDDEIEVNDTTPEETDEDEVLKHLQKLATEKLNPISKKLDLSGFTVLKKATTNVNPVFKATKARVSKWVLPYQESIVLMREFSGAELERLRQYAEDSTSMDSLNRRFNMIYDHIMSPKPASFEQWLKATPYDDIDHYMFAVYVSSFSGANFLPADCPNDKCKETFITDNIPIMDMVKFDNKEAKKKFLNIYNSEPSLTGKGIYCTEVVPISNNIAISFRQPSVYNIFELASISAQVRNKFASIIDYVPYIDTIYLIDEENKSLVPITYKAYPENAQKTIKSKLQKYSNIMNTFTVDQFSVLKAYAGELSKRTVDFKYIFPKLTCPKCGATTEEEDTTAEQLVFTRYQLGALTSVSLS